MHALWLLMHALREERIQQQDILLNMIYWPFLHVWMEVHLITCQRIKRENCNLNWLCSNYYYFVKLTQGAARKTGRSVVSLIKGSKKWFRKKWHRIKLFTSPNYFQLCRVAHFFWAIPNFIIIFFNKTPCIFLRF